MTTADCRTSDLAVNFSSETDRPLSWTSSQLDAVGATTSFLCAIHCALLPIFVSLLPLWGMGFLAGPAVEWVLTAGAASLAASSLTLGYRQHGSGKIFRVLALAVAFLIGGHLVKHETAATGWGTVLVVAGGLALVAAHGWNALLSRRTQSLKHPLSPQLRAHS